MYHIFGVFNYKGGELYSKTNLSYKKFLDSIVDTFNYFDDNLYEYVDEDDKLSKKDFDEIFTIENIREYISDHSSIHAGGDDICQQYFISGVDKDIRFYNLTDEDIKEIINILKDKYVAS